MIIFMITPLVWEKFAPEVQYDGSLDHQILDSVLASLESSSKPLIERKIPATIPTRPAQAFNFDPNLASYEDLLRLGLAEFLAKRVLKYRQKGGKFRTKNDLSKIYGLPPETFQRLYDYISLPERIKTQKTPRFTTSKPKYPTAKFDINQADTILLRRISGIGRVRAKRIVKYRDWLGGFVSTHQYQELWGFDSLVLLQLQKATFILPDFVPQKLDLDTGNARTLASHPYISYRLADVIVAYREQHGPFKNIQGLQEIVIINDSIFRRISPYLKKSL